MQKLSKLFRTPLVAETELSILETELEDVCSGFPVSSNCDIGIQTDGFDLPGLSQEFSLVSQRQGVTIPGDFLELSIAACNHLKRCGRANVLYNIAKGLAQMWSDGSDGSDSLLPASRMPMGLLEHISNFFISESLQKV